ALVVARRGFVDELELDEREDDGAERAFGGPEPSEDVLGEVEGEIDDEADVAIGGAGELVGRLVLGLLAALEADAFLEEAEDLGVAWSARRRSTSRFRD